MGVTPIAAEKKVLLFSIAGTSGPKGQYQFAFRNYPSPEFTARETANVFLIGKPDTRIAILRSNDEFGVSVAAAFKKRLGEINVPLVAEETFDNTVTDFRAPVTKVLGAHPTSVYIIGFGNPLGRIIVQLRELAFKGDILGGPEIAFADVLGVAREAAEGVRFLDLAFDAGSQQEPTRSFVERYRRKFGRLPTAVSAVVYDGWSLILTAAEKAGSTEVSKVASELLKINAFQGVCGNLSIGPERDVIYPLQPKIIQNGHAVIIR